MLVLGLDVLFAEKDRTSPDLISQDLETMVLFVIQRPDADHFEPQWERDPQFSKALLDASNKGVHIKVIKMKMTPQSLIYLGEVPYKLEL